MHLFFFFFFRLTVFVCHLICFRPVLPGRGRGRDRGLSRHGMTQSHDNNVCKTVNRMPASSEMHRPGSFVLPAPVIGPSFVGDGSGQLNGRTSLSLSPPKFPTRDVLSSLVFPRRPSKQGDPTGGKRLRAVAELRNGPQPHRRVLRPLGHRQLTTSSLAVPLLGQLSRIVPPSDDKYRTL